MKNNQINDSIIGYINDILNDPSDSFVDFICKYGNINTSNIDINSIKQSIKATFSKNKHNIHSITQTIHGNNINKHHIARKINGTMRSRIKRPRTTFSSIGIKVGTTLTFLYDNNVTCTVCGEPNKVEYNGKTFSISGLAKQLLRAIGRPNKSANGYCYFKYNNVLLSSMRH